MPEIEKPAKVEKPEKCPEGHRTIVARVRFTDIYWVWCEGLSGSCWHGPVRRTPEESVAAWNRAMRRSGPDAEAVEKVVKRLGLIRNEAYGQKEWAVAVRWANVALKALGRE